MAPSAARTGTLPRDMKARLAIVAGLVVGVVAAGLLLGGLLAFTPQPAPPVVAAPSAAVFGGGDRALRGNSHDVMAAALETVLPGVDVTT
jgi:hypothetical protein